MLEKIKVFWKSPPTWSDLHAVGNSSLAKATILMPLVGYLIIFNDNLIRHLDLSNAYVWDVGLLISYKLFLFYFGLTFISIGSIIYHFRCPDLIKNHSDILNFTSLERDNFSAVNAVYLKERVINDIDKLDANLIRMSKGFLDTVQRLRENPAGPTNEDVPILIKIYWKLKDIQSPFWRKITSIAYVIGFLLLAIPAIDTFIGVCIAFGVRLLS